jgi:hypothetical protein
VAAAKARRGVTSAAVGQVPTTLGLRPLGDTFVAEATPGARPHRKSFVPQLIHSIPDSRTHSRFAPPLIQQRLHEHLVSDSRTHSVYYYF